MGPDHKTKSPTPMLSKPDPSIKQSISQSATRQQLSRIKLPPVTLIQEKDVVLIYGDFQEENPYLVKSRPSENILTAARKIMSACSQVTDGNTIQLDDGDSPSGVKIGQQGNFSDSGIQVLSRYCSVARMQQQYKEEMAWLNFNPDKHTIGAPEIKYLCSFFESSLHDPKHVVASLDGLFVDFKSLSTLVGQRYIDNFVINYCLRKTLLSKQQKNSILCLPTEALTWLDNQVLEPIKNSISKELHHSHDVKLILMPLHMQNKRHWGLVCVDMETLTVWYDDGMKIHPPAPGDWSCFYMNCSHQSTTSTIWFPVIYPQHSTSELVCHGKDSMARQLAVEAVGWV